MTPTQNGDALPMVHEEVLDTSVFRRPETHWFHGSVHVLGARRFTELTGAPGIRFKASEIRIRLWIEPPWWAFWRAPLEIVASGGAHLCVRSTVIRSYDYTGTDWSWSDGRGRTRRLSSWLARVCDSVGFVLAGARLPEPDRAC